MEGEKERDAETETERGGVTVYLWSVAHHRSVSQCSLPGPRTTICSQHLSQQPNVFLPLHCSLLLSSLFVFVSFTPYLRPFVFGSSE